MKPQMKREIAISSYHQSFRVIYFYATEDAKSDVEEFGTVGKWGVNKDFYRIDVDARYDFNEVLDYFTKYGGDNE